MEIAISDAFRALWPDVQLHCIQCTVQNSERHDDLWALIAEESQAIARRLSMEHISQQPAVAASRKAYKALGKDPARYRLSAEALMRRIIKGEELYQINTVVDLINFASLSSGFSIGGYDASKIEGAILLDIGKELEPYAAIGRGELNIANLPVLRDSFGSFGSPTSDSLRTSITLDTKQLLMVWFVFGAVEALEAPFERITAMLEEFAGARNLSKTLIK